MKTKLYLIAVCFLFGIGAKAQSKAEKEVAEAVETLKQGIVQADRNLLEQVASAKLVYGHSSGKVQTKAEFVDEIVSQNPIDYKEVRLINQTVKVAGKTAVVRHIFESDIIKDGAPSVLKIGNMLIFQKQHGKWKLLARQAYKI